MSCGRKDGPGGVSVRAGSKSKSGADSLAKTVFPSASKPNPAREPTPFAKVKPVE